MPRNECTSFFTLSLPFLNLLTFSLSLSLSPSLALSLINSRSLSLILFLLSFLPFRITIVNSLRDRMLATNYEEEGVTSSPPPGESFSGHPLSILPGQFDASLPNPSDSSAFPSEQDGARQQQQQQHNNQHNYQHQQPYQQQPYQQPPQPAAAIIFRPDPAQAPQSAAPPRVFRGSASSPPPLPPPSLPPPPSPTSPTFGAVVDSLLAPAIIADDASASRSRFGNAEASEQKNKRARNEDPPAGKLAV